MKISKVLSMFMAGIMLSSSVSVNVMANNADTYNGRSSEDPIISGSALNVLSDDIDVEFNVTGKWNDGFTGEITITNVSNKLIENWQIEMQFPQEITNIWNASIVSHEGLVYNIKNAGGNNNVNIPANGSVTFGFSGTYEGDIIAPKNVQLISGKTTADEDTYTIKYELLSDWGDGYNAQITITNNSDSPIEAWQLEFDFDREITNIWNAVIEKQENSKYFIINAEYNSVISANSSVTFGFNGNGGDIAIEPANYALTVYDKDGNLINSPDEDDNDTETNEITDADYYDTNIGYAIGDYEDCVTQDLTLPTVGAINGSTIIWSSSNLNLISNEGKVTRPTNNSEYVTLTATFISKDGEIFSKDYTVKVIKKFVPADIKDISLTDLKALNGGVLPYIYVDEGEQYPRWISGKYSDYIVESPEEAIYSLNALKTMCGFENPQEEYVIYNTIKDDNVIVYRLQQVYKGIPVEGAQLVVGTDLNGNISYLIGKHYSIDINATFTLSENDISNILMEDVSNMDIKKIICYKDDEFVLAWEVITGGTTYVIEDNSKNIISQDSNNMYGTYAVGTTTVEDVNYPKIPWYNYIPVKMQFTRNVADLYFGRDKVNTVSWSINNYDVNISKVDYGPYYTYELYDSVNKIMCIRKKDDSTKKYTTYDPINNFGDIALGKYEFDYDATNLFLNARKSLNAFRKFGGNNKFNIIGGNTLYIVLNDEPQVGAGLAGWDPDRKYIGFYKDDKAYDKLDVCGHEMTHAILNTNIGLNATGTMGSIHEGYADIMGCIINRSWNFANVRDIKSPSKEFYTSLDNIKIDNNFVSYDNYKMSTIISHAAYKMYEGRKYDNEYVSIDYDTLGKLWYKSIKNIASTLNYYNGDYRNYKLKISALRGNMHAVGIGVYQAAQDMNLTAKQKKLILDCFADAGIYICVSIEGSVIADVSKIPNAKIIISTKNSSTMNAVSRTVLSNSNGDYFINIGKIGDNCVLNCYYGDYNQYSKEIVLNDMTIEENIILTKQDANTVSISGNILSALDRTALENISVYLYDKSEKGLTTYMPVAIQYTDKNGYFCISDLPIGTYIIQCVDERNLTFECERYSTLTKSLVISDDVEVTITLENTYPIYIFHVIHSYNDNNRVPVAHAKVSWFKLSDTEDEYLWYETVTDDNGIYSIALADGIYNLYLDGEFFLQIEVKGGLIV